MIYKPDHFIIQELVSEKTYLKYGPEKSWWFTQVNMLRFIDMVKKRYSPKRAVYINTWLFGGDRNWSGNRTPDSDWYSPMSQHTFNNAYDMIFQSITAEEIRVDLKENWGKLCCQDFPITVEKEVSWVHCDGRQQDLMFNEF